MNQQTPAAPKGTRDDSARAQTRTTHDQGIEPDASADRGGQVKPRVEPSLPHELDESARSQASATPRHAEIGKRAMDDELGPTEDTDRGPVLDKVYHDKVATDRGHTPPRR